MTPNNISALSLLLTCITFSACKKLINISPPAGTISTSQVFSTDAQANSAAAGMYSNMINSSRSFSNYGMTIFGGMSADELLIYDQTQTDIFQFQQNSLLSSNDIVANCFWDNAYSSIYAANSIIDGVSSYSGVHDSLKIELTGEAEFVRAFCNFYLVNLYGDIPLVNTINWRKSNLLPRTTENDAYQSIISDLKDAQNKLPSNYLEAKGERIIPNKWAASALLARVYLYTSQWDSAAKQATSVINTTELYNLNSSLDSVFLANSSEAIWQLQQSNNGTTFNATPEGYKIVPSAIDAGVQPFVYLPDNLLSSFDSGDQRRVHWIDSTIYNNTVYYFPYKYKVGPGQASSGNPDIEYYMVLRLAEQYLIRAEAEAQLDDLTNAAIDLNTIRKRSNVNPVIPVSQAVILAEILHERQVELFAEWGHRWLDLKRLGIATQVLSNNKGFTVTDKSLLYPIPMSDLQVDPNLTQNIGY